MSSPFAQEVSRVIRSLRSGEVVCYGDVAHDAGRPGAARAVGTILATSPDNLPWWRVVRSNGTLPPVAPVEQARLLVAEGVVMVGNRVTAAPWGRFRRP